VLDDVIEQLAGVRVLHNEVELALRLDDLVQLNYSGVSDLLQNFDFSSDSFNVHLILDLALLKYFNGDLLLRNRLDAELHLPEGSFPERPVD